jgi:chemotaxis protein MotA
MCAILFATPSAWQSRELRHSTWISFWISTWKFITTMQGSMADSLPGLGIVAAVLGVVITMGALGGPPEEIGRKVAAALVGTFLGILLCYGFVGPIAANMAKNAEEERAYLYVLRVVMITFLKGTAPIMAVEAARRAIPGHVRPSFQEVEKACRGGDGEASAAAAAASA